jgi:hypothetical protein
MLSFSILQRTIIVIHFALILMIPIATAAQETSSQDWKNATLDFLRPPPTNSSRI